MRKILISGVAAAAVTTSLMAATQSKITLGSDINGTLQDLSVVSSAVDLNISDTNGSDSNKTKGILYNNAIGIGKGNLITISFSNGYVHKVGLNNLYLVDLNDTSDDYNSTGMPVVAKMTDFALSKDGNGYKDLTFKFGESVPSNHNMIVANKEDTNSSSAKIGYIKGGLLAVSVNKGLGCGDKVRASVIKSTDQSGNPFNVANAPVSTTGVDIKKGVNINKISGKCPTYICNISLADKEKDFGPSSSTATCPTCAPSTTPTLSCPARFYISYNGSTAGSSDHNTSIKSIKFDLATTDTSAISSVKSYSDGTTKAKAVAATLTGTTYSTTLTPTSGGVKSKNDNNVSVTVFVDGTTVIKPRTFDLSVKVNDRAIDSISRYITFKEAGTRLGISYMNDLQDYRTFVRITSTKKATIQAIVTTEDGKVSDRVDVTKADGTPVEISAATGGAVVVEAADIMRSAKDAGFTGVGHRFNATLFVKTTGSVDAVAYQTAGGSQRYLPVSGATGGGKN